MGDWPSTGTDFRFCVEEVKHDLDGVVGPRVVITAREVKVKGEVTTARFGLKPVSSQPTLSETRITW
jgi:hypothetical protein